MAPKHSHPLEDPPAASSSEDEEVSSSEEETDLDEEKKENLTSDEEDEEEEETDDVPMKQPEKAKNSHNADDSETESESDSESEKVKPKQDTVVKSPARKPVLGSSGSDKSKPGVVGLPAKSAAKRPALKTENGKETKRAKTAERGKKPDEEDEKRPGEDTAKKLFQRLFSEDDEIALLQGMVDFIETKGDPYEDIEGFCEFINKSLNFEASKAQLVDKLRRLKKKYDSSIKKGYKGEDKVYLKAHDQKAYDLWKKIWGKEGALLSVTKSSVKPKKNHGSTTKGLAAVKTDLFSSPESKKEGKKKEGEMNVNGNSFEIVHCTNTVVSGKDVAAFLQRTNMAVDETVAMQGWNMIDGTRKKELEEKLKKLQVAEMEVFMERNELTGEIAKEIFKKMKASV